MAMLKSLMFLLIIFSMGNANVVLGEKCPSGWTNYGLQCYNFFPASVNWVTAEKNCQSLGGNLASVHSRSENDFLLSLLPSEKANAWIGGHDDEQEGQWLWTDGTEFQYSYWCSELSDGHHVQNCMRIFAYHLRCWSDLPCRRKTNYICQRKL